MLARRKVESELAGADAGREGVGIPAARGDQDDATSDPSARPLRMLQNLRLTRYPSANQEPLREGPKRSALRRVLRIAAFGLVLLLVLFGAGIAALMSGPIDLGFLRGQVTSALERSLGERYRASVAGLTLAVDPVLGLVVRVTDLVVHDSGDQVVATIPSTLLAIDPLAVVTPKAVIRSAEVNNAWVGLVRTRDGRIILGTADSPPPPQREPRAAEAAVGFDLIFGPVATLDRGLSGVLDRAERSGFERFSSLQMTVDMWDAQRNERRRFARSDLSIDLGPEAGRVTASLTSSGYSGRWSATAERTIAPNTGERTLSTVFSQVTLPDIFPVMAQSTALFTSDIPIYGRSTVTLSPEGKVTSANLRLDLGAGNLEFRSAGDSVLLDEASVRLHWDLANNVIVVDPSSFYFGLGRAMFTGAIRPEGEAGARRFGFDLEARNAILAPRDSPELPLLAEQIKLVGSIDFDARLAQFDRASITTSAGSVQAAGSVGLEGPSPSIAAAASFSDMPASTVKQLWPPFLIAGTRRWVLDNVTTGELLGARLQVEIPADTLFQGRRPTLTEDQLRLDFELQNVTFNTFGDLPQVRDASGVASLAGTTFGLDMQNGTAVTPSGQLVNITAGAVAIPNTNIENGRAQIEVQLAANARAMAELANADPIHALRGRDIAPASLSGQGTARVSVKMPLEQKALAGALDWSVQAELDGFTSTDPVEGRMVENGNVTLSADPDAVRIAGNAKIDGVQANVDFSFATHGGAMGSQRVRLALDEAARDRLGLNLDGILGGTVGVLVSDMPGGGGQHFDLDLTQARIMLSVLGWSKGIGVPATMVFDLVKADAGYDVRNLAITGDGFGVSGSGHLDDHYTPESGTVDKFVLRRGDAVSFTFKKSRGGYDLDATGTTFDIRGLLAQLKSSVEGSSGGMDVTLRARIDHLVGFNGESLDDARLNLASIGGRVARAEFSGHLDQSTIAASYNDPGQGGNIDVNATDAGALFRFVNLYSRMEGGALRISGRQFGTGPLAGVFEMADFRLVNEAAMETLVTNGPDGQPTVNPKRIGFERMVLNFAWHDGRIIIDDALLRGGMIGATFSGLIDLAQAAISITGTYIPAYRVNNIFGQIPILGFALGGGDREGLVGITFKIDGPLSDVRVAINPLSAIAPGIFRKIFEFQ